MARSFSASVKDWSEKAKRNARLVAMDASQVTDGLMTERVVGVTMGGAFVEGKVPVGKTSGLIESHGTGIGGFSGAPIEATLAGFELGDSVVSGFSIEYAKYVEYGTSRMPGRFFVRNAVQRWEATVASSAAKFAD